ncbi:MAG: hypothetical protein ACLPN5_14915 [Roseiarcus sp.]
MRKATRRWLLGGVSAVLIGGSNLAWCDSIVVSSENPKYSIGESLKDDVVIEVGAHETLRLMNSDSGETREITGPYTGKISSYTPPCKGVLACDTGQKDLSIGATREIETITPDVGAPRP